MDKKRLAVLGSTGSIGQNTLDIVRRHSDKFKIVALAAGKNKELFREQVEEFKPKCISLSEKSDIDELKKDISYVPKAFCGADGLLETATCHDADLVVSALVGASGLAPTMAAIRARKDIALANKEVLVMAGRLVTGEIKKNKINLLPIDSEHSAIFQSIIGHRKDDIKRLILTASGGPFLNLPLKRLPAITPEQALRHPKWKMGKKVTIDSATLMNKGLEVIEAMWLFDMPPDKITVHIHPQSVIHSMVEYVDGSIVAQLGPTDMRGPISYALSYPDKRLDCGIAPLDLCKMGRLTFIEPDKKRFPALGLAYEAIKAGGVMPVVLNAADEIAVDAFLQKEIRFTDITGIVETAMDCVGAFKSQSDRDLNAILEADREARERAREIVKKVRSRH
ncbi:MAG: 1-deoxy-D-xylulose-5-phosphate reductoisomerase [Deltaproteobacteria bacterium GWC2_42_51]|nr:MAG: 1-deoxy-D-xylulose-5-phosphate reductoisomerase [Deltaproteobacteria bacterium GWC2_42_51]OGP38835.1 MAG: 1-deoxy-D-xylulose-5-phosphate reductoisomerase [Deltaproteobacteria bacterium GWD2_42_10]OGP47027.1 MAG: 1-deoxy-D-xylulose-5-phosphate reductoisomerase [Deltaproteobacteria bacterium GWF2_42_12]OGQ24733.1 MAG: 1-deoxy-D-xylulose-5-phosphate reductoisomerase [Deltaproteobacteria bacterium RIFCSPHIGHO2_02_FULL_42_44]OGQ36707.1 MAG: 1-deoxy-D-xylulose-5-phosphate reductoisomerase [De